MEVLRIIIACMLLVLTGVAIGLPLSAGYIWWTKCLTVDIAGQKHIFGHDARCYPDKELGALRARVREELDASKRSLEESKRRLEQMQAKLRCQQDKCI